MRALLGGLGFPCEGGAVIPTAPRVHRLTSVPRSAFGAGDLWERIQAQRGYAHGPPRFSERTTRCYTAQLVLALRALHCSCESQGRRGGSIVHRCVCLGSWARPPGDSRDVPAAAALCSYTLAPCPSPHPRSPIFISCDHVLAPAPAACPPTRDLTAQYKRVLEYLSRYGIR